MQAAELRKITAELQSRGELEPLNAAVLFGKADFAERRNAGAVMGGEIDVWGYGTLRPLFKSPTGDAWVRLDEFTMPSGLSFGALLTEFYNEIDTCDDGEPNVDVLTYSHPDGRVVEIPLCTMSFAFEVMAGASPWATEFRAAIMDVYRRAAMMTGLADKMGIAEIIAPDGEIPSEEDAKAAAFRGPAVTL